MAEILSPGVFIEEVPSLAQVVQPVSTSTMGIIGATDRGPTDEATLVTSFEQFERIFGPQIRDSRTNLSMAAYYANGGRRSYVVRVAPADAVSAAAEIQSNQSDHGIYEAAAPVVAMSDVAVGGSVLRDRIVPSSMTLRWRSADSGGSIAAEGLMERDGVTALLGDGARQGYEGLIDPLMPAKADAVVGYDSQLPLVDPTATLDIDWTTGAGAATTISLVATGGALVATGTSAGGSATLDLRTGLLSLETVVGEIPDAATAITITYTPTTDRSASDDGAGALVNVVDLAAPGTVDYDTGEWTATAVVAALVLADYAALATYNAAAWDMAPVSVGTWANELKLQVQGNVDFYDITTDSYSRYDVFVLLLNSASGNFEIVETYEEVDFVDTLSGQYFPDVLNDLSDLVSIVEPALIGEAPNQLDGQAFSQVVAAGDDVTASRNVVGALAAAGVAIRPRTVAIAWTDDTGAVRAVTDDGAGNLVGDVDGAGTNTINYTTGSYDFTTDLDIDGNTLVTVSWYKVAGEAAAEELFGDVSKQYVTTALPGGTYVEGTNGTYDATNYGRDQFSSPTILQGDSLGLYALNRVEEIMQVTIPDFAGDLLITTDLLDYVDGRASLPAGGDRFAILAVPQGSSAQEAVDYFRFDLNRFSKFAALYWPWVKVADPLRDNRPTVFPPVAHIAGIYARTDQTRNVGKSPGGTIDGALRFLTGLELVSTQGERDLVYPNKINPLISSSATGLAVWGVRTIAQESDWRYINARRLFMFAERSVYNSTFWIVFENNGPGLWARIKSQVQGFLLNLFNDGLFAGSTPSQAFFVTVDETNNTPESIAAGQVIIDVGMAPNKPAEFIRFRFSQKTLNS